MYSKEVRERALDLVAEGKTPREVSRIMGGNPSASCIHNWVRGRLPVGKRRPIRYYPLATKLEAIARMEQGESYKDIAEDLDCKDSVVLGWRRIFQEAGADALRTRLDAYLEQQARLDFRTRG